MIRKYKPSTINKALLLINRGYTRKEAAKRAGIGLYALHYYIAKKASPKLRKILLNRSHIQAIKTLQSLL